MSEEKFIPFIYECTSCGSEFSRDEVKYLCPQCGEKYKPGQPLKGVLSVIPNYEKLKRNFNIDNPDWDLFLPIEKKHFPNLPVGNTPFLKVNRLAECFGFKNLWLKNDGLNPSGSLKDRASFLVVAEANRLGENQIVAASTGNAASSLASICAAEGKEAMIFVPDSAPKAKLVQIILSGAKVVTVKGNYDDAFKMSIEHTSKKGGLNRNTAYHPFTIEGKKTAGLEIFEQNNFQVPDAIIIPVGDGVIISGIYKAFYDLKMTGLTDKMPKLVCVQAENSAAIYNYIQTGKYENLKSADTIADSISVCIPSNADMAKNAVSKTGGFALTVNDEEILKAQKLLFEKTGVFAEPSSSTAVAALHKITDLNLLDVDEQVVLLITGNGLKDIETPLKKINLSGAAGIN